MNSRPSKLDPTTPPKRKRRRWLRWTLRIIAILVVILLIAAELFARHYLGLGDPPLWIEHPEIEYMAMPSRTYHRYGNIVTYNAYSMRNDEFSRHKEDPRELRVMCLGDSVINGGSHVDQADLLTARLKTRLVKALERPATVGNISAGSWGPGNLLAYVKTFGLFDADILVLVLSSHDHTDHPTFEPVVGVERRMPDRTPLFALSEVTHRFLPIYFGWAKDEEDDIEERSDAEKVRKTLASLREIIYTAHETGATVIVLQHPKYEEVLGEELPGHRVLSNVARSMGIEPIQAATAFRDALEEDALIRKGLQEGESTMPYRDRIHPNQVGHRILADLLFDEIMKVVAKVP